MAWPGRGGPEVVARSRGRLNQVAPKNGKLVMRRWCSHTRKVARDQPWA